MNDFGPDFDPAEERRVLRKSLPWIGLVLLSGGLLMAGLKLKRESAGNWLMGSGIVGSLVGLAAIVRINARPPGSQ
jgi:hypothetical protein